MFFYSRLIFINFTNKKNVVHLIRNLTTESIRFDACTGCEIPCKKHVSYPSAILKEIDQSDMRNSVEKHRRHLCIGQSILPSQWPKDVKDLQGNYIKKLTKILQENNNSIGYSIKLTATSIVSQNNSEQIADWYLFPDQIKLHNVHIKQIKDIVQKLFVNDQSIIKIKDKTKTIEEQLKQNNHLPVFYENVKCEKLHGLWILVCCHYQRDQRCGVIGPILVDEIENFVRKTDRTDDVHCLKISHVGGHRFAGNVIIYPSGTWYGRVLTCHIPLLIDAYTSSSTDLKDKLKPLLRGYLQTS
ncbi:unnamed protein product [Rotaria sp. Silwood1]|nr:unnamed protein product [Rotaria sp. Silwood1]